MNVCDEVVAVKEIFSMCRKSHSNSLQTCLNEVKVLEIMILFLNPMELLVLRCTRLCAVPPIEGKKTAI